MTSGESALSSFKLSAFGTLEKIDESRTEHGTRLFAHTSTSKYVYALGTTGTGDPIETQGKIYAYPTEKGVFSKPVVVADDLPTLTPHPQIASTKSEKYLYINSSEGIISFSIDQTTGTLKQINQERFSSNFRLATVNDEAVIVSIWNFRLNNVCRINGDGSILAPKDSYSLPDITSPITDIAVLRS
jgi:6-phosphogluconolactonase (cycloisomerase 2 family)